MKKALLISAVLALAASCGWLGQKKQATNVISASGTIQTADADTIIWSMLTPDVSESNNFIRAYDNYEILSKDSGEHFVLSIKGKEYALSDILDYGEPDILVYASGEEQIIFIGLVDIYGSTYFIYRLADDALTRLGDLNFDQPSDVEETGGKKATFSVSQIGKTFTITLYLDGVFHRQISLQN
jgi:hypothetical protein